MMIGMLARAALCAAFGLVAPATALAQTQVSWTTFVVHDTPVPEGERVAAPGEPLLRQAITSTRAARLEEEVSSYRSVGAAKSFLAGTAMFGVAVPDGWIYCAVARSSVKWLFTDFSVCYQDVDADGLFDHVRDSGVPFGGVPLFVFQPGPPKKLDRPVRYSRIPYADGPRADIAYIWKPTKPKLRPDAPPPPPGPLTITTSVMAGETDIAISSPDSFDLSTGRRLQFRDHGAYINLIGFTPEGSLRYEVISTMPAQVQPMKMTVTTSTYWYVVTY